MNFSSQHHHGHNNNSDDDDDSYHHPGLEIATNSIAFVTKFFPFATKISEEVANL